MIRAFGPFFSAGFAEPGKTGLLGWVGEKSLLRARCLAFSGVASDVNYFGWAVVVIGLWPLAIMQDRSGLVDGLACSL